MFASEFTDWAQKGQLTEATASESQLGRRILIERVVLLATADRLAKIRAV